MRVVLQRVKEAKVTVSGDEIGQIKQGLLLLIGYEEADDLEDVKWMVKKILNMRIFDDQDGKMNLSVKDVGGELLLVSQFTLHASTKKGNRPSFIHAANPNLAKQLYERTVFHFNDQSDCKIQTGEFGAMMEVSLVNDGPVTIIMDTKNKN